MKGKSYLYRGLLILGLTLVSAGAWAGERYGIEVGGLACPFCAYGIEKALGEVERVESVETHIRDGLVVVTMEEGGELDEATAERAVEGAGFSLRGFERIEEE